MKKSTKKKLARHWGYLLVPVIILGWSERFIPAGWIAVLSLAVVLYCLAQAPMSCCAIIRTGDFCRKNAPGIIRGCSSFLQHREQKRVLLRTFDSPSRRELARQVLASYGGKTATVTAAAGSLSAVAATVSLAIA